MSMVDYYAGLYAPGRQVCFERAAEGSVARLLRSVMRSSEVLDGHRGLMKYFDSWSHRGDGKREWDGFEEEVERLDTVVVIGDDWREEEGLEWARIRVVVATHALTKNAEAQLAKHDARCSAVRGIFSPAGLISKDDGGGGMLERLQGYTSKDGIFVQGLERQGQAQREFAGRRWVYTEEVEIWGGVSGGQ